LPHILFAGYVAQVTKLLRNTRTKETTFCSKDQQKLKTHNWIPGKVPPRFPWTDEFLWASNQWSHM